MDRVFSWARRHCRPLCIAALALVCLGGLFCIWLTAVLPAQTKSRSVLLNDRYEESLALTGTLSQTFTTDRPLLGLGFRLTAEGTTAGTLHLALYDDETGALLASSTGDLAYLAPEGYTVLGLDTPVAAGAAGRYRLELTADYAPDSALAAVGYGPEGLEGELWLEDAPVSGSLGLLVVTEQIGSFLSAFFWAFGLLTTALVCLCAAVCTGPRPWPLHRVFLLLALALGLLFCLLLPPYAAPDEQYHINQAFSLASRMASHLAPGAHAIGGVPIQDTYRRPTDQDPLLQDPDTTVFTWREYWRKWNTTTDASFGQITLYNELQASSNNSLYLVSGLAVLLGYALHLGFAPTLLLGRLANLLAFALLGAWAVKRAPFGKRIFLAVGLLPMTLHLAASFSRDSLLLGLLLAFTAQVLDCAFGPGERAHPARLAGLAVMAAFIAPVKMVYIPLTALVLLIPAARIGHHSRWVKAAVIGVAVLAFVLSAENRLTLEDAWTADEPSADSGQTAGPEGETGEELPNGLVAEWDKVTYSVPFMLEHPGTTLKLLVNTVLENTDHYLKGLVGGNLSYYTLDLAWGWVLALYALLAAAVLGGGSPLSVPARLWAGLLALAALAMTVGGCLLWTPTYYTALYGLQGRYLLGLAPAALLAARPRRAQLAPSDPRWLALAFALVDAGVLLNVFLAVLAR